MSRIVELLPNDFAPSDKDAEILLELAYLVTAADGKLLDSELSASDLPYKVDLVDWHRITPEFRLIVSKGAVGIG